MRQIKKIAMDNRKATNSVITEKIQASDCQVSERTVRKSSLKVDKEAKTGSSSKGEEMHWANSHKYFTIDKWKIVSQK